MADEYEHTPVTVHGKSAVIIGGTSGIGKAIALGFAAEGADVVATSRSEDRVKETATLLRERGASTAEITCDVTRRETIETLFQTALDEFGSLDILINSAGAISRERFEDIPESEWWDVLDVQLTGSYRTCQTFTKYADEGSVINISSIIADLSTENLPAYSAAKGGVNSLTRAAAKELGPDFRVNAIAPGFTLTPFNAHVYAEGTEKRGRIDRRSPLNRVATPSEMVGTAIYLASDASSYVTGEVITVDGGFSRSAL